MNEQATWSKNPPLATAAEVADEWDAALADAQIDSASVALWTFPEASSSRGFNGLYYAPDLVAGDIQDDPSLGDALSALDEPENRSLDRFCVWAAVPKPLVAARMRHELEHARQCRKHGAPLWSFAELVGEVLAGVVGDAPGGAALYNATPIELDASAAAARHVRRRFGQPVLEGLLESSYLGTDGPNLRPQLDPSPIETLPTRTLAFLWLFPRACEEFERRNGGRLVTALEAAWPGAATLWKKLESLS